jgi:hypothetical protein
MYYARDRDWKTNRWFSPLLQSNSVSAQWYMPCSLALLSSTVCLTSHLKTHGICSRVFNLRATRGICSQVFKLRATRGICSRVFKLLASRGIYSRVFKLHATRGICSQVHKLRATRGICSQVYKMRTTRGTCSQVFNLRATRGICSRVFKLRATRGICSSLYNSARLTLYSCAPCSCPLPTTRVGPVLSAPSLSWPTTLRVRHSNYFLACLPLPSLAQFVTIFVLSCAVSRMLIYPAPYPAHWSGLSLPHVDFNPPLTTRAFYVCLTHP